MFFGILSSQDISFRTYEVENGLSHNTVSCILQDDKGFMWFGTKDGLNRFDGYDFKLYKNDLIQNHGLESNFIRSLHEFDGYIWVGTDNGLFRYSKETESFKIIKFTENKPVLDIKNDADGNLWIIVSNILYRYQLNDNVKQDIESYDQFNASFLTQNDQGEIWIASSDDLYKYVKDNNSFQRKDLGRFKVQPDPITITEIFAKGRDSILLGTKDHGALIYNSRTEETSSLLPPALNPLYVRNFMVNNKDELWIATESGIYIYNTGTKSHRLLEKNYNDPTSLSDNAIYTMVKDREGGIWIGTYFGGVNYYAKPRSPIQKYFPKSGENSISGNAVREITKDKFGNLWVGTEDGGLNKLSGADSLFAHYTSKAQGGNLSHTNIHGLLPRGDKLWIGTFEHGIDVMDIKSEKIIKHYSINSNKGLRSDFILYFYETEKGKLLVLTASGIHYYDKESDRFEMLEGFPEDYHYTYFLEDSKGGFWAGTYWDGLFYFDPKTKKKRYYRLDRDRSKSISSNTINGIFEDSDHNLWITTENGLNRFDYDQNNFKIYTTRDGLSSNVTYSILEDNKKNLWISTSNGITQFNMTNATTTVYAKADGLLNEQFNYSSAYRDSDGAMYFGSVKGMIKFNPKNFKKDTLRPDILLTGLRINNEETRHFNENTPLNKSISYAKNLQLNNSQASFTIDFAALHYNNPEMVDYWYKLDGLSEEWIALGKKHHVSFIELPYGDYTFNVKSRTSKGVWSTESEALAINILPPFAQSKIAFLLYSLTSLLLIFIGLKHYHARNKLKTNRQLRQLETLKEKELYQAKIDFFNHITHEIRTPLTLIKSPLDKLLQKDHPLPDVRKNLSIMEKNTNRLLALVNQLLDFRKAEINQIQLNFIEVNMPQFIRDIVLRFDPLIEERGIEVTLQIENPMINAFINEEAFQKIVSNLLGNALKYAAGEIQILLSIVRHNLILEIKNDGDLIPVYLKKRIFEPFFRVSKMEGKEGTGIGLSLASALVELHKGKLYLEIKEEMNCFILEVPLHQEKEFSLFEKNEKSPQEKSVGENYDLNKIKPTVLIVEDNSELLNFINNDLNVGYNTIMTTNGVQALKVVQETNVHLVITDISMPLMNGIDLCKTLKNTPETSHIPLIILTARSTIHSEIEGLESGADAYIGKPFSMEYLKAQIKNLLENRKHILEAYSSSPLSSFKTSPHSKTDQDFLERLDTIILEQMQDANLNVEVLASTMNMSRSTLYRKIKHLSQMSPNDLINNCRLKRATQLLKNTDKKIYQVAEEIGYSSPSSFSRNFHKKFNMTPTEYIENKRDY